MKILLVGNHTCGNRGDGAILRGLVDAIKESSRDVEIDIISRFSLSSSYLLNSNIMQDPLLISRINKADSGLKNKIKNKLYNYFLPRVLISNIKNKGVLKFIKPPRFILDFSEKIKKYDAIIQVGGSFFVDLYGSQQFDHIFCALLAKKPIYLVGHSVGPFQIPQFKMISKFAFSRVNELILREDVSKALMEKDYLPMEKVTMGVDTAFLVKPVKFVPNSDYILDHWYGIISNKKTVAITVRKLAPFDKRLGITQENYEIAIAGIVSGLIKSGYQVVAFSTCTGIESYNNDDRMVALSVKKHVNHNDFHVVIDEINDLQLGILLGECILTVGTRLHSAIISMNFGTPAIAINYEHKSLGIMNKLELNAFSSSIDDVVNGELNNKIFNVLNNIDNIRSLVGEKVALTRNEGKEIIENLLKKIG